ncbi:MAG: metalloprotease PmbA, partial [Gammaproteobacteria bacterium]|nr:metalloprotease PmbA [Gammaproteobacteria bacterium]
MHNQTNSLATNVKQSHQPLADIAQIVIDEAKCQGASASESAISRAQGLSVTVRLGDVETVERHRDKSLVVSVYFGQRTGSASTSDFDQAAIKDTVRAACSIAKYTAEDECNGLADADRLATEFPELD